MKIRLLSLFLVVCMCISIIPAPASATETEPPEMWEISVPVPAIGHLMYQNDTMNSYFNVTCPKDCGYTVTSLEWLGTANGYWFNPGRITEDITEIRLFLNLEFTEPPAFNTDYLSDIPLKVHFQDQYYNVTTYVMSEANRVYQGETKKPGQWQMGNCIQPENTDPTGVGIEIRMATGVVPVQPDAPPIIRFDRNEHAQGFMHPQFAEEDGSYILPESEFYPDRGFVFMNWDLGKPGQRITVTENTRLFAQWGHSIMFGSNGGEGYMASQIVPIGGTYVLPECEFTPPEGKVFDQWNLGPVGTEIVVEGGTVFLTAQWKDIPHEPEITTATVTANVVGGTWSDDTTAPKTIEVTLTDGNGVLPYADLPTGMIKLDGYTETGLWHKTLQNGDLADCPELNNGNGLAITGDTTVSYVFETLPVFEASPESLNGGGEVTITCSRPTLTCDDSSIVIGEPVQNGDTYVRTITLPNTTKTYKFSTETESHLELQLQVVVTGQHVHQMTHHSEIPATCTEDGVKEYWHCEGCNKNFADEAGTQELTDLVIPATGHYWDENIDYEWSEDCTTCTATRVCWNDSNHQQQAYATVTGQVTKQPTETEMGQTTYTASFDVDWASTQTKTLTNIPVQEHVHQMTHHSEIPATCTEDGVKEYWHCEGCNKNFADEAGTQELTDLVIPATGHYWDENIDYEWSEDCATCTATRICWNDSNHQQKADATVTSQITKQPTETEMGQTTYTASFDVDWASSQTKTLTDIPVLPKTEYTVTFEPMNGQAEFASATTVDGKLEKLPDCTKTGFVFAGWYDSVAGGNPVTLDRVYTENTTLYARWTAEEPMVYEYEVRFHANGVEQMIQVPMDEAIGSRMPADPVRDGYAFVEWNTSADGTGAAVTAETEIYQNMDVYAIWERIPETYPIEAQFVRQNLFGQRVTTLTLQAGDSVQVPNANGFLQSNRCWLSENGKLSVASNGTLTYAQLLAVLGGNAPEGSVVRFTAVRAQDVPQPEPTDPEVQLVSVHFMDGTQEVGQPVRIEASADRSFLTAAQVAAYLPKGYDFAEVGQDYAIINGAAEIPVKRTEQTDPVGAPITVTFSLSGWGYRLEEVSSKTMTVTLNPGEQVNAPFAAKRFFGSRKTVQWNSSVGLQIASGDVVTYELLAQMLGGTPAVEAEITFTGTVNR